MLPYSLANFATQRYQNEGTTFKLNNARFIGDYSRNHMHNAKFNFLNKGLVICNKS